jgi:iron complex transport system substrate-binding protein
MASHPLELPVMARRQRIVSLAPSVTSILVALGARRDLVGVTRWCPDVAPVGRLPRMGDAWALDVADVVRLRPTLVIGSVPYRSETVARLLDAPFPFLATNPRSLADIYFEIRLLGLLVGRSRAAERLVLRMKKGFAGIAARTRRVRRRPRVYSEAWPNPRISSPPWVAELIHIAGGRMCVPAGQRVTERQVARARPEVIVIAWAASSDRPRVGRERRRMAALPGWKSLPAIRGSRVYVVRDELLNTPGPPLIEGARLLFEILHPGER